MLPRIDFGAVHRDAPSPRQLVDKAPCPSPPRQPRLMRLRPAAALCAVLLFVSAAPLLAQADAPQRPEAPNTPEASQPRYFTRDFSVEDFDLAAMQGWLARLGIELPFTIEGKVDLQAQVGVPITALTDGRAYRFHGTADSSRLVIDGLELLDVAAEADYADGVLKLEQLRLQIAREAGDLSSAGRAVGAAQVQLLPRGDLTAQLELEQMPIKPLFDVFPELRGAAVGRLSGKANAQAAIDKLREITGWKVEGKLDVSDFESHGFAVATATAEAQLADGRLTLSRFRADSAAGSALGSGELQLVDEQAFTARFEVTDGDLAQFAGILSPPGGRLDVAGETNATLAVSGTLSPVKVEGEGRLTARNARFDRFELRSLELPLTFSGDVLHIEQARAELGGGTLHATADVALGPAAATSVSLTWDRVQLAALARLLAAERVLPPLGTVRGAASGSVDLQAPPGTLGDPVRWTGRAEATVVDLVAYAVGFRRAEVALKLADGALTVERLEASEELETLSAAGRLELSAPQAFTVNVEWRRGDLSSLQHALREDAEPAVRLAGRFDLATNLSGELQPLKLRGDASLAAQRLRVDDVVIDSADLDAHLADDQLDVRRLQASLYGGRIQGDASLSLDGKRAGQASLTWRDLDLAALLHDALHHPAAAGSTSRGNIRINAPAGGAFDPRGWNIEGSADVENFSIRDRRIERAHLQLGLADRVLQLKRLSLATAAGGAVTAQGRIAVDAPYDFETKLNVEEFDLALVSDAVAMSAGTSFELEGTVAVDADVHGRLKPLDVQGGGSAHGERLQGGPLVLDDVQFGFDFNKRRVDVTDLTGKLYQGTVDGSLQIPLQGSAALDAQLAWRKIEIGSLINAFLGETPIALTGELAGSLAAHAPAESADDVSAWTAVIRFKTSSLESQAEDAGQLEGSASLADGGLVYKLSGQFLDGALDVEGRWPSIDEALSDGFPLDQAPAGNKPPAAAEPADSVAPPQRDARREHAASQQQVLFQPPLLQNDESTDRPTNVGRLQWRGVPFARLRDLLPEGWFPEPLDARATLDLTYRHRVDGPPTGDGELTLEALSWGGALLTDLLRGRVRLGENLLQLAGFRGRYAEGLAQLGARIPLTHPGDLTYELLLTRGMLQPALAPFLTLPPQLESRMDVRLTGQFGALWKLAGTGSLDGAELAGAPIGSWRVPLIIAHDPTSARTTFSFRRVRAELARGRITGDARVTLTSRLRIEGAVEFDRVDLQTVLRGFGVDTQLGSGRISGTASFDGGNIRELADVTATLDARLEDTAANTVPILGPLQPFMPTLLPSTTFNEGRLRGRLRRNVFQLERLSLASRAAEVYATGDVSLAGRLNLDVTAGTGRLRRRGRLARILLRSLLVATQPELALLLRANNFLADRVIHAQVTGTVNAPVIRFQPLELLGEEALRFFLSQAAG